MQTQLKSHDQGLVPLLARPTHTSTNDNMLLVTRFQTLYLGLEILLFIKITRLGVDKVNPKAWFKSRRVRRREKPTLLMMGAQLGYKTKSKYEDTPCIFMSIPSLWYLLTYWDLVRTRLEDLDLGLSMKTSGDGSMRARCQ